MILGSQKFRIGVVRMEICLDVLDCLISGTDDIFVRYSRCVDKLIGISVLNILLDVFHLEVNRF